MAMIHYRIAGLGFILCCALFITTYAQPDSTRGSVSFAGYIEAYWGQALSRSSIKEENRPGYLVSYHRNKELALNMALLQASYSRRGIKANLGFMSGTYAEMNLAHETPLSQHLFEANVSVILSQKRDVWIEAGLFPSHIGFESAIGYDCWNLTRSILAENSPYYEQGVRIKHQTHNQKWFLSLLLLNGWQTMRRVPGGLGNDGLYPSFGHQLTWKPNARITLNSSSFIGDARRPIPVQSGPAIYVSESRLFHNFYGIIDFNQKMGLIAGLDCGLQNQDVSGRGKEFWFSPILIGRYIINSKLKFALRTEYFQDRGESVIANYNNLGRGLSCFGYSGNLDFEPFPGALFRLEYRAFLYETPWYESNLSANFRYNMITGCMGVRF